MITMIPIAQMPDTTRKPTKGKAKTEETMKVQVRVHQQETTSTMNQILVTQSAPHHPLVKVMIQTRYSLTSTNCSLKRSNRNRLMMMRIAVTMIKEGTKGKSLTMARIETEMARIKGTRVVMIGIAVGADREQEITSTNTNQTVIIKVRIQRLNITKMTKEESIVDSVN